MSYIAFEGPLDLDSTLMSGQTFRWIRDSHGPIPETSPWYTGVVFNNLIRLRLVAEGIEFRCFPDDESFIGTKIKDYLRLDDDLNEIYRAINRDDRIDNAITKYRGLRLLRQEPWECLISFICSAVSNIPRITSNVENLSVTYGRKLSNGTCSRWTFPEPDVLASVEESALRELGLGFRAKYVVGAAKAVKNNQLDLSNLRETTYEDALKLLTSLPGVGDKIANCVLLFSLNKLESFPVDTWIQKVLREWYFDTETKLSVIEMRLWAQRYFKPYSGYANQYLFHDRRLSGR